jgi:lysozyme
MNLSPRGYQLIKQFEGFSLDAYTCPAGIPTIGYGHRLRPGDPQQVTEAEAERMLTSDVHFAELCVSNLVHVKLTQGKFDALVSFVFNLGPKRLVDSTLLKVLNTGDYMSASSELLRWDHAGGKELPGLKRRREAEWQRWHELEA